MSASILTSMMRGKCVLNLFFHAMQGIHFHCKKKLENMEKQNEDKKSVPIQREKLFMSFKEKSREAWIFVSKQNYDIFCKLF